MTNRNTKWLLALLLCAVLALGFCMGTALAHGEITTWAQLQTALNAGGTVTLTQDLAAEPNDTMLQVSGTVTLDLNGHTLNRNRTTAHADGHVIIVNAGGYLTLTDSSPNHSGTITGGYANNGGGINNKGTLRAEYVTITGNHVSGSNNSGRGAGIYNNNSMVLIGCTVSGNSGDDAGGIFNDGGTVTLSGVTVTDNTSTHHGGGGIVNYGALTLDNCTVSSNTSHSDGGGIWHQGSAPLHLNGCTFSGNTSGYRGGALYVSSGTACPNGCTFSGNTAHDGGAIYITANGIVINNGNTSIAGNTSVTGNTATVNGGGGITNYGKLITDDCLTVTGNTAVGNGGGIWVNGIFEAKGTVTVKNNKRGEDNNNLYLKEGKVITVTGALSSDSNICISGEKLPRLVTSGWSDHQQNPSDVSFFAYDSGLTPSLNGGEVFAEIKYMARSWNGSSLIQTETTLTEIPRSFGDFASGERWYVILQDTTMENRVDVPSGCVVNVILINGVTLTCRNGIRVVGTLNIYGQRGDTGKLVCTGGDYQAGIGGNDETGHGTIRIYGGTVEATGGKEGAGIGSGNEPEGSCGPIEFYGGSVSAWGGNLAAAIGGGDAGDGGTIRIYGGTIYASNGGHGETFTDKGGAAIGGGEGKPAKSLTIYGGTVNAEGYMGPALGCGASCSDVGTILICGGEVHATGHYRQAGIGGCEGYDLKAGSITITAGTVIAEGGYGASGIGGAGAANVSGLSIKISGGNVTATAGPNSSVIRGGAGIGAGGFYNFVGGDFDGTITISGGTVRAEGTPGTNNGGAGIGSGGGGNMKGTITISGGTVRAIAHGGGAAIGSGAEFNLNPSGGECSGTVSLTGGMVWLKIDDTSSEEYEAVIGHGQGDNVDGTLNLGAAMCVRYDGSATSESEAWRIATLRGHDSRWILVTGCDHPNATYTCTEESHTLNCFYCLDHTGSAHIFDANYRCTVCGYEYGGWLVTIGFDGNGGTGSMEEVHVIPHTAYILPENGFTAPDGKCFKEWTVEIYNISVPETRSPGDRIEDVTGNLVVTAIWQPIPFGTPDFVLPDGLTELGANAFEGVDATVVEIPADCGSIGDYAFKDCANLTMIRIPAGCALGAGVFDGCTKVYVFGTAGSPAEAYCQSHGNCVFVAEGQN